MCIIIWDDKKNVIHLNNGSMAKALFFNMKVKGGERFKLAHLHLGLVD